MKNSTKIAIGIATILIIAGATWYVVKSQKASEDQFEEFKIKSLKAGWDIFSGITLPLEQGARLKWKQNLSKKEAQQLIDCTAIKDKVTRDAIALPLIQKWYGKTSKAK